MFSSLLTPFITLVACAAAGSAAPGISTAPGLNVKVSTSDANFDGLGNLKVTATIVNTGGETLKLLNDPSGVLNPFSGDTFTITDPSGSRPSFSGPKVDYNSTYAAGLDYPSGFTVLTPGDSIDIVHDLTAAYDFSRSGAGDYSIEPSNHFTCVDADGTPKDLYATIGDIANVKLPGNLTTPRRVHRKRAGYRKCTAEQKVKIRAAYIKAKEYATDAATFIKGASAGTTRYVMWFGAYDLARKEIVQERFEKIRDTPLHRFVYDCTCRHPTSLAITDPERFGEIVICPRFWELNPDGPMSQAGTFIHEVSHYLITGGTEDWGYGPERSRFLARRKPYFAIDNADNYACFVEQGP